MVSGLSSLEWPVKHTGDGIEGDFGAGRHGESVAIHYGERVNCRGKLAQELGLYFEAEARNLRCSLFDPCQIVRALAVRLTKLLTTATNKASFLHHHPRTLLYLRIVRQKHDGTTNGADDPPGSRSLVRLATI